MSKKHDHIELANNTHAATEFLKDRIDEFPGWVATLAFYKALHVVEALLLEKKHAGSHDHRSRNDVLQRFYPEIYKQYRPLFNASLIARYLHSNDDGQYKKFSDFLPPEKVQSELLNKRLVKVENHCLEQLADDVRKMLKKTHVVKSTDESNAPSENNPSQIGS